MKKFVSFVIVLCLISSVGVFSFYLSPTMSHTLYSFTSRLDTMSSSILFPVKSVLKIFGVNSVDYKSTYGYSLTGQSDVSLFNSLTKDLLPEDLRSQYSEATYCIAFKLSTKVKPKLGYIYSSLYGINADFTWVLQEVFYVLFDRHGQPLFGFGRNNYSGASLISYSDSYFDGSFYNPHSGVVVLSVIITDQFGYYVVTPFTATEYFKVDLDENVFLVQSLYDIGFK